MTAATLQPDFWRCRDCGCFWRDNHDDSVSLSNQYERSCPACEFNPTSKTCEPLYLRAEALAPPDDGWQPIASAPKDGTYVLLCNADGYCEVGWSHGDYWGPIDEQGAGIIPTHWQPLPSPPRADAREAPRTDARAVCHICGKPATCIGEYETCTGNEQYACDSCCGHGNEDGHCRPVDARAAALDAAPASMSTAAPAEGWARRQKLNSRAFHYFRAGRSLCRRTWSDPMGLVDKPFGIVCPECRGIVEGART